jgi:nicotinamidase-related amidase
MDPWRRRLLSDLVIDKKKTSLVIIDLQKGITAMPSRPYAAKDVIMNAAHLAEMFRKNSMPVFVTRVAGDPATSLKVIADQSFARSGPMPPDWSEIVPEIGPAPSDILITKRQWGAFYGTELELQLRRRGMDTIVLCGISTDYGVESTARFAYEYGFQQVFVEDAMASRSDEQHQAAVTYIFPRIGRVCKTNDVIQARQ